MISRITEGWGTCVLVDMAIPWMHQYEMLAVQYNENFTKIKTAADVGKKLEMQGLWY